MHPAVALSLAETIGWVSMRAVAGDAGATTRSEVLRPPWFPPYAYADSGEVLMLLLQRNSGETARAVEHIIRMRRAELLKLPERPRAEGLAGGRILCTDFNSDQCGAATEPSVGFFDWADTAGWDTWFHHVDTGELGGVVACWIPPALLAQVDAGQWTIPVSSAWWDDEAPPGRRLF